MAFPDQRPGFPRDGETISRPGHADLRYTYLRHGKEDQSRGRGEIARGSRSFAL